MFKLVIVFILLCSEIGCSSEVKQPFSLDYLFSADPKADAQKAIERGDFRVYATYSGGPYTPGIKRGCAQGIVPIQGTVHAIDNYPQAQFNNLADLYAEYYNFQIKAYLIGQGDTCLSWSD